MKKTTLLFAMVGAMALGAQAQVPFQPLDTNFSTQTVIIPPSPLKYDVLYIGNHHYVHINGGSDSALAKQNHDFIGLIPETTGPKSKRGHWLIVNQEITNTKNTKLGDGGGQTVFKVKEKHGEWEAIPSIGGKTFHNVDFSTLGGTNTNCGGATTMYGTTLSAEEFPQNSNASLYANGNGIQDTSDYTIPAGNGPYSGRVIKRWQNYGWMVEADPKTAKGLKKYYSMGRYGHEGGYCMKDGKTVYLTDDNTPGVLFKFIANKKNDYTNGQLYAYKQGAGGVGGSWVALPMELDSLLNARDMALKRGATTFTRLEWIALAPNGKLYITETGADVANHTSGTLKGAKIAHHNIRLDTIGGKPMDNILTDYYGRVLELDPKTNHVRVYVEGGNGSDGKTNFSGPDGLTVVQMDGIPYLLMNEDIIGSSQNRMPAGPNNRNSICEIYFVDLRKKNPTVDDLRRFIIGPVGAETTGGVFTPDGKTYFVNIQHPSSSNIFPFNNSTTIAVTGFEDLCRYDDNRMGTLSSESNGFSIYPNPASQELHFNKTTDVTIYDAVGNKIRTERNVSIIDISGLEAGMYFIQTIDNEVKKLIKQ